MDILTLQDRADVDADATMHEEYARQRAKVGDHVIVRFPSGAAQQTHITRICAAYAHLEGFDKSFIGGVVVKQSRDTTTHQF